MTVELPLQRRDRIETGDRFGMRADNPDRCCQHENQPDRPSTHAHALLASATDDQPALLMAAPVMMASASILASQAASDLSDSMVTCSRSLRARDAVEASSSNGVTKVGDITVNAAPDVPTEARLRKQLSDIDALNE
ncbi:hypothetical protein GCM10022419_111980 [Nonomuraea rosea]|uniref:Uncharacterized protein n=1 Tax=Nonomuraea rosea TaxID=638574 RepID=A0ABP6ZG42_9ACTN